MSVNRCRYAICGDGDEDQRQQEQNAQRDFLLERHFRLEDHWNGERHQHNVCDDVTGTHGNQLRTTRPALGTRIRHNLPIMRKGLTFCECRDNNADEGEPQKTVYDSYTAFIEFRPGSANGSFDKFENGDLRDPYVKCVQDTADQNEAAADGAVIDRGLAQTGCLHLVGSPYQNNVDEGHSRDQRNHAP